MRVIKRKILIESLLSRVPDATYGTMTASTIYVPIFITHTFDDIGLMLDHPVSNAGPTYPIIGEPFNTRQDGTTADMYYNSSDTLTGETSESRLTECQNYGITQYNPGFVVSQDDYIDYTNTLVNGETKLISTLSVESSGSTTYTVKGNPLDLGFETDSQRSGIYFTDIGYSSASTITTFVAKNEGTHEMNSSLSAITKLDEYLGSVFPSEIQSDVFIERGRNVIFESHFKLGEVESIDHLKRFGNGYFTIIR